MIIRSLNILTILGIFIVLFVAFALQIFLRELPCPLCFLQRFGFLGVAFGLLLNLRFGLRPSHYAIALISALFAGIAALQQIFFHIIPGTGAYGAPIFSLHLYTWSFIISLTAIVMTIFMLAMDKQYQAVETNKFPSASLTNILFGALVMLVFANSVSVLLECGVSLCPSDPIHYYFWNKSF